MNDEPERKWSLQLQSDHDEVESSGCWNRVNYPTGTLGLIQIRTGYGVYRGAVPENYPDQSEYPFKVAIKKDKRKRIT